MINISEIINTDCYIDCGSNEKLRDVVAMLGIPADDYQTVFGIYNDCIYILVKNREYVTLPENTPHVPTHHINDIIF
jgi:hypothetical protein